MDDRVVLRASPADSTMLEVLVNGDLAYAGRRDSVPGGRLIFNGLAGNDVLTVDFAHGNPLPDQGVSFDGQDGVNELRVVGGPGFSTAKYETFPALRRLDLDGGPSILLQNSVNTVTLSSRTDAIRLTNQGNPLDYTYSAAATPGTTTATTRERLPFAPAKSFVFTFTNPTSSLTTEGTFFFFGRSFSCGVGRVLTNTIDSLGSGFDAAFSSILALSTTQMSVEALRDIRGIDFGGRGVVLRPRHDGTAIDLGGRDAPGVIGLSNAELNRIHSAGITLGNSATGNISVSAPIDVGDASLRITTGRNIVVNRGAGMTLRDGNLTFVAGQNISLAADSFITTRDASITLNALGGTLVSNARLTTRDGTIGLQSSLDISLLAKARIRTRDGSVTLLAGHDISLASQAEIETRDGDITLTAADRVLLAPGARLRTRRGHIVISP